MTEPNMTADQFDTELYAAVLPYWPIWAAAQFASKDEYKQLLNFVHVYRNGDAIQIESTDGHRAFRYRVPTVESGADTLWRVPEQGLLLHAKPLKKAVAYSKYLTVTNDLRAVFHGGKKAAVDELSSVNLTGQYSVNHIEDCGKVGTYPNINQLWPDKFSNSPEAPWGFSASYLKDWCAVVEKLSTNGVFRTEGNGAKNPFVMTCSYSPRTAQHFTDAQLELLLMPVQIRI
jgi:hypothetical protein